MRDIVEYFKINVVRLVIWFTHTIYIYIYISLDGSKLSTLHYSRRTEVCSLYWEPTTFKVASKAIVKSCFVSTLALGCVNVIILLPIMTHVVKIDLFSITEKCSIYHWKKWKLPTLPRPKRAKVHKIIFTESQQCFQRVAVNIELPIASEALTLILDLPLIYIFSHKFCLLLVHKKQV